MAYINFYFFIITIKSIRKIEQFKLWKILLKNKFILAKQLIWYK